MQCTINNGNLNFTNVKDFSLDETFLCGQTFRWDKYEKGFKGFAGEYLCYIFFNENDLIVTPLSSVDSFDNFKTYMTHYLALDLDYAKLKATFSQDKTMAMVIDYAQGIRVLNQEFFEMLITFIISQNNNIPRIKKIVDSLAEKYGTKVNDTYAFPTAIQLKDVTIDDYNELKMGFRSKYVYDAVQKVINNEVDASIIKSLNYEQAQKYLMQIKGVGPKVADCVLLFGCAYYESFPKDVWINRALDQLFPNGLPECIKGYEGIAQQYIFNYARLNSLCKPK